MLYGHYSSLFPEISFRNKCYFPSNDIFEPKKKGKSQTEEWEEMEQKEQNSD